MCTAVEQLASALLEELLAETPLTPYHRDVVRNAPVTDKCMTDNDGYGMRKTAGKWQVTFRPGAVDKSRILEDIGKIRQRQHDELMKRAMPKW